MTSNQIAWWANQEQIRSHQQNELNERNKQSITSSLGEEQNRISNRKIMNDFVLGQQSNSIQQQQADTASRRATQDYDIGLKNVANTATANINQSTRNAQDYEIGKANTKVKATEVSNNYILGVSGQKIQSIRNAQDFALGQMQQTSNARQADASLLSAGAQIGKLNPAQIVVALAAPTAQKAFNAGVEKVVEIAKASPALKPVSEVSRTPKNIPLTKVQKEIVTSPRMTGAPRKPAPAKTPTTVKPASTSNKNTSSTYRR